MRFSIEIEMSNEDFAAETYGPGCELGRILGNLGAALSARGLADGDSGKVRDINGNTCGEWRCEAVED